MPRVLANIHLKMETSEFIGAYLEADDEDGPYKARQEPCPFLCDDDRCTIYDVRSNGISQAGLRTASYV